MFLERTLLFTFAMHGLGMLGMVLFLLPVLRPAAEPSDGPWRACLPSWRVFLFG
ncbi:MAG: hypothetical protein HYY18_08195 [Planctomycetes bacterium]|nr:hypothetical protein [Planctomycetota bacterium]